MPYLTLVQDQKKRYLPNCVQAKMKLDLGKKGRKKLKYKKLNFAYLSPAETKALKCWSGLRLYCECDVKI